MTESDESVERRLEWMAEELLLLKEMVDDLSGRLTAYEEEGRKVAAGEMHHRHSPPPPVALAGVEAGETERERGGAGLWLSRLAATCFVLVVALVLRTVTDNGMVEKHLGSLLGSGYALALIAWGWRQYERRSRLAPVFPLCGVLLLLSIVYEAHAHFASLSNSAVYAILLAALLLALALGLRYRAPVLLYFGTLGPALVAVACDFPTVNAVWVAVFLLATALAGYLAERRRIDKALSWLALALVGIFWLFWGYKLSYLLHHNGLAGAEKLGLRFYLPLLALFWLFYLYNALAHLLARSQPLGVLARLLPTLTLAGAFGLARLVVAPWPGGEDLLAALTLLGGGGYFLLAFWLVKKDPEAARGCKEYLVAGIVALLLALPELADSLAWAMLAWAAVAYGLFLLAERWRSGGVRVISYLLALVVGVAGGQLYPASLAKPALGMAAVAGLVAAITLWHYRACRMRPPEYDSEYFALFDRKDQSGVLLLLVGLLHGFNLLRLLVLLAFAAPQAASSGSFGCAQSVILNLGAVLLFLYGLRARRGEVLVVAVAVLLFGAGRVFLVDLFKAEGLPLVLSVFSFGVTAATASLVERRWRLRPRNGPAGGGGGASS